MAGLKTILSIEDDNFISDMYKRVLDKAGYQVDVVPNGRDAIVKARSQKYDLILLDIMLPEVDGVHILNELRGPDGKGMPGTRIIVMTNFDEPEESRAAMESKADGYLIKADITPSDLLKIIQDLEKE
jgi:DNA-binding response OmpR family regulator